ncbi:hypothetical protein OIV83_003372 [Microbotryomycetes sp. JL201]|nr:hypothetical protein OIV83_003372 [Microbotryomycetes sp. JL201]
MSSTRTSTRVRRPPVGVPYQPPKRYKSKPTSASASVRSTTKTTEAAVHSPVRKRGRPPKQVGEGAASIERRVKRKIKGAEWPREDYHEPVPELHSSKGKGKAREQHVSQDEQMQQAQTTPIKHRPVTSPKKRQTPQSGKVDMTGWVKLSRQAKVEIRTMMEQSFRVDRCLSEMLVPPFSASHLNAKGETDLPTEKELLEYLAEDKADPHKSVKSSREHESPQLAGDDIAATRDIQSPPTRAVPHAPRPQGRAPRAAGKLKRAQSAQE